MNILFTSVGRRSYLIEYFKQALEGKGEIHAANSSEISPAFPVADKSVVTPLIYDEGYIPFLIRYCQNNRIDLIISLFDADLPVLAKNKQKFEEMGVKVLVSDSRVIEICNDKWKTCLFLKENGFFVPKSYLRIDDVIRDIQEGKLQFPVVVKPRRGMGSIGVMQADDREELTYCYRKVRKQIESGYLNYEARFCKEECIIMQETLQGQEYGVDIINNLRGEFQTAVVKKKYAMRSGETDCAVTVEWEAAAVMSRRLSALLGHVANLDADVFEIDGNPFILEMNARFGGGYPFSHMAGVNLPRAILRWFSGEEATEELKFEIGVKGHKDIRMVRLF